MKLTSKFIFTDFVLIVVNYGIVIGYYLKGFVSIEKFWEGIVLEGV